MYERSEGSLGFTMISKFFPHRNHISTRTSNIIVRFVYIFLKVKAEAFFWFSRSIYLHADRLAKVTNRDNL